MLTGQDGEWPRKGFFYWSDDGDLVAMRYDRWKLVFMEQRSRQFGVWMEPFVKLRIPLVFDLRMDPFERASVDANGYYEFILTLHRLNFLRLPISDDKLLYRRYIAKREAGKKEKLLTLLFYRVPLINPNAFLNRTYSYVKPLFTWWFFCATRTLHVAR